MIPESNQSIELNNPKEDEDVNYIPSLTDMCSKVITTSLSLESALDILHFSDLYLLDELKTNTIKFIALNMVSFFEANRKLFTIPSYLVRDIENFIKSDDPEKLIKETVEMYQVDPIEVLEGRVEDILNGENRNIYEIYLLRKELRKIHKQARKNSSSHQQLDQDEISRIIDLTTYINKHIEENKLKVELDAITQANQEENKEEGKN